MEYFPRPETITAYTTGDCWHLALILRKLTGKRMVFANPDTSWGSDYWEHVGLEVAPGKILDINGVSTAKAWKDRWAGKTGYRRGLQILMYMDDDKAIREFLDDQGRTFPECNTSRVARRLLATHAPHLLS